MFVLCDFFFQKFLVFEFFVCVVDSNVNNTSQNEIQTN